VTQAGFQIAEWKTYIKNHYDKLKMDFPGISVSCSTMIVISRSTHENFGRGRDIAAYMQLVKQQLAVDEVLTYDDLLARSKQAYVALSSLAIESTD
jgi:hypothetical protein